MDQAAIQAKLNAGYGQVATRLGQTVTVYRPDATQSKVAALDARYMLTRTTAFFNADPNFKAIRPPPPDKPIVYVATDRTPLEQGDYLLDTDGHIWFVGMIKPLMATSAMRCNRTFSLQRPVPATGPYAYGGNAPQDMTTLLTSWPGFLASKTKGLSPEEKVPGDTKLFVVQIYLPVTGPLLLEPNDVLLDDSDLTSRYTVALTTETGQGWEVNCYYAGA